VIVIDASAVVAALVRAGKARQRLANDALHAPHLLDSEVTDVLRRLVLRAVVTSNDAERALTAWRRIAVNRYPTIGMIDRIWELRHNVSAYDAAYIALAEHLDCHVVTAAQRLAGATGPRCTIELVPQ
jgi:predicted nucleic acid-binding protein